MRSLLQIGYATDLLAMDKAMFGGKASSDPYVKFSCGGREVKSSTKKKTLNPVWDETLSLEVLSSEAELLVSKSVWEVCNNNNEIDCC